MVENDMSPQLGPPTSDELLRLIFESTTDFAIVSMDRQGAISSWNEGAERLLGYAGDDIVGRDGDVIFTPEDRKASAPQKERTEALARGRAVDERWHLRQDGSRFWASGLLMPLTDGSGFVKIVRDLTARRAAQERLRESEEVFRVLATNIPQLVFRTRGNGERTWGSPQWIVFTGLSFEDSVGRGWLDAVHPDDREATLAGWAAARETGEYDVDHRILHAGGGEYRWHQTRAVPLGDPHDPEADWVGTSTDIHEMRDLQERQTVLLAELQHRTRNLLAVVQSMARQTMRASSTLEEFVPEFEGRLRTLSRVQGLLARDNGGIGLCELIQLELQAHGEQEPGKVTVEGPDAMLPAASAQAVALAIHELTTNAVKHGALNQPAGRLRILSRIERGEAKPFVVLEWRESDVLMPQGGTSPVRRGFGRELIEVALPRQLDAETRLEFGPGGVTCRIVVPIDGDEETTHG